MIFDPSAPAYLKDLINIQTPKRSTRSSEAIRLDIPSQKTNKTYGDRAFKYSAPKAWNELPGHIREIKKFEIFKSSLKTFLFKEHYY